MFHTPHTSLLIRVAAMLQMLSLAFSSVTVIELSLLAAARGVLLVHCRRGRSLGGFLRRLLHNEEHLGMGVKVVNVVPAQS